MNIILSPELENAEYNPNSADRLLREFSEKLRLPGENPKIGKSQDKLVLNPRSFPFKNYTISYFQIENGVEIYRIIHDSRNTEGLFEDYFEGLKP